MKCPVCNNRHPSLRLYPAKFRAEDYTHDQISRIGLCPSLNAEFSVVINNEYWRHAGVAEFWELPSISLDALPEPADLKAIEDAFRMAAADIPVEARAE